MDMCYDGALVMPSSYAVMDAEEMTYVEGGLTIKVDTWIFATAIDVVCTALFGGAAASAIGWVIGQGFSKLSNAIIKAGGRLASAFKNILANGLSEYITSKMGMVGFTLGFTSVGGFIMNMWDMCDNRTINGYIKVTL